MASIMDKLIKTGLVFLLMVTLSMLWIIINWPYTPQDAIEDSIKLGPYGIIIDIVILSVLALIWVKRGDKQE